LRLALPVDRLDVVEVAEPDLRMLRQDLRLPLADGP